MVVDLMSNIFFSFESAAKSRSLHVMREGRPQRVHGTARAPHSLTLAKPSKDRPREADFVAIGFGCGSQSRGRMQGEGVLLFRGLVRDRMQQSLFSKCR